MTPPVSRPTAAASGPEHPPEGDGTGADAVEALARTLDPLAFDPRVVPKNLGQDWNRTSRQVMARDHAERAIAAGYRRLTVDAAMVERVANAIHEAQGAHTSGACIDLAFAALAALPEADRG